MTEEKLLSKLNNLYDDAVDADSVLWAEQRSNVLLVSGDHYNKKVTRISDRLRGIKEAEEEVNKIRITKNHIGKIAKLYVNNIVSMAPGAMAVASNDKELKDQKSAEMHQSVLAYQKDKHKLKDKIQKYASDFVTIGEVTVKISWDWEKGYFKRQEPILDEMGEETGTNDVWSGDLVFERIYGFDRFRPAECKNIDDAPWEGIRKMMSIKELKRLVKDDENKSKKIVESTEETYTVFDSNSSSYKKKRGQVLVREIYYKPSFEYPKGYFYIFTEDVVLFEGELPFGIWPLASAIFDEIQTTPRGRSPIKQWRPFQVELNRASSKIAEHQITLGDDKLIINQGSKLQPAGTAPGIRAYSAAGASPMVISGRTGDQYRPYVGDTINELYQVAMLQEELEDKQVGQVDPYSLLLQSAKWKKRFSLSVGKFEQFVVDLYKLILETTRAYIEEDELIQAIGSTERVNISEFKNADPLCYQIKVEAQVEDIESRLGKKLSIDRYVQYAGTNLSKEDIGKFIRLDPYLNKEQLMNDFTMDYDNANNLILAIDRGEQPELNQYDDADYMLKRLVSRKRQADFKYLSPQAMQIYDITIQQYEQIKAQQMHMDLMKNSEIIPAQGMLITCDFYVPNQKDPSKQNRVRIPSDSVKWLLDRLENQGQTQQQLQMQQDQTVADIVGQMKNQLGPARPGIPQQMPLGQMV